MPQGVIAWGLGFLMTTVVMGCASNPMIVDQRPAMARDAELESTIWIGGDRRNRLSHAASAVVIGPDLIVTNRHFLKGAGDWWDSNTVECRTIRFDVDCDGTASSPCRQCTIERYGKVPASLASRDIEEIYTDSDLLRDINDADWATLRIEDPPWSADSIAVIHEPARDPAWRPPEGTRLFMLGYSPVFLEREGFRKVNPSSSRYHSFIEDGPYTICGPAIAADSLPAIDYSIDLPKPEGHSGGGVYLWNEATSRLELIGINQGLAHLVDGEISKIEPGWTGDPDRLGIAGIYVPIAKVLSP